MPRFSVNSSSNKLPPQSCLYSKILPLISQISFWRHLSGLNSRSVLYHFRSPCVSGAPSRSQTFDVRHCASFLVPPRICFWSPTTVVDPMFHLISHDRLVGIRHGLWLQWIITSRMTSRNCQRQQNPSRGASKTYCHTLAKCVDPSLGRQSSTSSSVGKER